MGDPSFAARQCVVQNGAHDTIVSDEILILPENAALRRFLFALLMLVPLLLISLYPKPASAETACAAGEFQYPLITGNCYECPDTYNHDILYPPDDARVCNKIGETRTAVEQGDTILVCPSGQFANFATGTCNSCPTGYDSDGGNNCVKRTNTTATYDSAFQTCSGYIDGLNGKCYTCPSGYSHNPLLTVGTAGVCSKTTTTNQAMSKCGTRSRTCTTTRVCPLAFNYLCDQTNAWVNVTTCGAWSYTGCGSGGIVLGRERVGNNFYKCASGFATNILPAYNASNKCTKTSTSKLTADFHHSTGCKAGTFDGLNSKCYKCDAGYSHNALLPVGVSGVCFKVDTVAQSQHNAIGFLCPGGQFLDPASGNCYACDSGFSHNTLFDVNTSGVCFKRDYTVADLVPPRSVGEACVGLFSGNCESDLVCDFGAGICRNDPPLEGEPCGIGVACSQNPDKLACHSGNILEPFRCTRPRETGEICSGLGQGSCQEGNLCALTFIDDADEKLALRCTPRPDASIISTNDESRCLAYYNKLTAGLVNAGTKAFNFGYGSAIGAGVTGAIETGVVYGPPEGDDVNGQFGCYQTFCAGVQVSAGISDSACTGFDQQFPGEEEKSYEVFAEYGSGPTFSISVAATYEVDDFDDIPPPSQASIGGGACVSAGAGVGYPFNAGADFCVTKTLEVDINDFWPENPPPPPVGTGAATDTDGDGDVAGTVCSATVSVRSKSTKNQLTWAPVEGAQSYFIRRSTEGPDSGYETLVENHATTYATYLDEGLTDGTTYWYRVAPRDDVGTELCTTIAASGTPAAIVRSRTRTR